MDIKRIKQIKILISVFILIAAICVAYLLDFSKWKEIGNVKGQITQMESLIEAKKSYYAIIDSKIKALNDAGWTEKKDSIAINFDSSLFFTPKINNFFKTIVASSGMSLSSMTSSTSESTQPQTQTTNQTEEGGKTSLESTETAVQQSGNYFSQLQGPIKKTTINLSVAGTYTKFKELLSLFEGQTRIITVKSVTVSSVGQEVKGKTTVNNLNFSVIADVYSY
jgi:copper chaperone CopZ